MVFFSSGQILKKRGTPGIIEMKELGKTESNTQQVESPKQNSSATSVAKNSASLMQPAVQPQSVPDLLLCSTMNLDRCRFFLG
jgi:hypothetical protein